MLSALAIIKGFFFGVVFGFSLEKWPKKAMMVFMGLVAVILLSMFVLPGDVSDWNEYYFRWGVLVELGATVVGVFAGRAIAEGYGG